MYDYQLFVLNSRKLKIFFDFNRRLELSGVDCKYFFLLDEDMSRAIELKKYLNDVFVRGQRN